MDLNDHYDIVKNINIEKRSVVVELKENKYIYEVDKLNTKTELFKEIYRMNILLK